MKTAYRVERLDEHLEVQRVALGAHDTALAALEAKLQQVEGSSTTAYSSLSARIAHQRERSDNDALQLRTMINGFVGQSFRQRLRWLLRGGPL